MENSDSFARECAFFISMRYGTFYPLWAIDQWHGIWKEKPMESHTGKKNLLKQSVKVKSLKQNMTWAVNYSVLWWEEMNQGCVHFLTSESFPQFIAPIPPALSLQWNCSGRRHQWPFYLQIEYTLFRLHPTWSLLSTWSYSQLVKEKNFSLYPPRLSCKLDWQKINKQKKNWGWSIWSLLIRIHMGMSDEQLRGWLELGLL